MKRAIYVVRSERGPVKVGIATKPRERLSQLRVSSPVPLHLDFAAETDGDARILERRAHAILAGRRLSGEWFEVDSRNAVAAVRRAAQELGFPLRRAGTSSARHRPARGVWRRPRRSVAKRLALFRRACWRVTLTAGFVVGLPLLLFSAHQAIEGKPLISSGHS